MLFFKNGDFLFLLLKADAVERTFSNLETIEKATWSYLINNGSNIIWKLWAYVKIFTHSPNHTWDIWFDRFKRIRAIVPKSLQPSNLFCSGGGRSHLNKNIALLEKGYITQLSNKVRIEERLLDLKHGFKRWGLWSHILWVFFKEING